VVIDLLIVLPLDTVIVIDTVTVVTVTGYRWRAQNWVIKR